MKKKIGLLFGLLLGLGLCTTASVGLASIHNNNYAVAYAEGESEPTEPATSEEPVADPEPEPVEEFECSITWGAFEHGKIKADITEGHVGDIVTLTAEHDLFYLIDYVAVNGANLVEDEEISGLYKFALVEGENHITAKFVVDTKLLGELSVIYEQASNKDWTNLFSVENVVRIVLFLLDGGLLLAMVRYFIKDKRIANNVERSVKETCNAIVPETTKKVVVENTKQVLEPMFAETTAYQQEIIRVIGILVKCIALMQEDTPDSRRAVLNELANLNVGDMKVIEDARKFIDSYFQARANDLQGMMNKLDNVIEGNKKVVEKIGVANDSNDETVAVKTDNGTQI